MHLSSDRFHPGCLGYMGGSKNSDIPKWMVKIMENPIKHGMIWGKTLLFGSIHMSGMKSYPARIRDCFINPMKFLDLINQLRGDYTNQLCGDCYINLRIPINQSVQWKVPNRRVYIPNSRGLYISNIRIPY